MGLLDSSLSDLCDGTGHRSWMIMYGVAELMAGLFVWVACLLSGGVVGRCFGGTVGGGIGVGIISQRSTWHIGGFTGGILDGMMIGGIFSCNCWQLQCHHRCHNWKG